MSSKPADGARIALTGATGALGGAVLAELLRRGYRVQALRRARAPATAHAGVTWIEGALDEPAALDRLVADCDAIVHCALAPMDAPPPTGRSQAEHFIQTNVAGTLRLIERTPATRRRQLLFASSLAVYGPQPHRLPGAGERPLDEDFPVWPREFYGAHKAALEKMVVAAAGDPGMNASAFRLGAVLAAYRQRQRDLLARTFDEARAHGALRTQLGAYVLGADDAAGVLADALGDARVAGNVFNTFDRWLDFSTLAPLLGEILQRPIAVACPPAPAPTPAVSNARLLRRGVRWNTDAWVRARLEALAQGARP
jgi:nucleoside-diphosphate-sugar epimerase